MKRIAVLGYLLVFTGALATGISSPCRAEGESAQTATSYHYEKSPLRKTIDRVNRGYIITRLGEAGISDQKAAAIADSPAGLDGRVYGQIFRLDMSSQTGKADEATIREAFAGSAGG